MIKMIVAVDESGGIGKDGGLLCHLPNDLKYFKNATYGQNIVMGRKTWDSLPMKPLPNRTNIVLTRSNFVYGTVISTVDEIVHLSKTVDEDFFIIGGQSVYEQFMQHADMLYVTHIHKSFDADTFFPEIDKNMWELVSYEKGIKTTLEEPEFTFAIYSRKQEE